MPFDKKFYGLQSDTKSWAKYSKYSYSSTILLVLVLVLVLEGLVLVLVLVLEGLVLVLVLVLEGLVLVLKELVLEIFVIYFIENLLRMHQLFFPRTI